MLERAGNRSRRIQCGANVLALALGISAMVWGCGDDDDEPNAGGGGGRMDAGGGGGKSGSDSTPIIYDEVCEVPRSEIGDPCLTCIASTCCEERSQLVGCSGRLYHADGGVPHVVAWSCYDPFLSCVLECFSRPESSIAPDERLVACGQECVESPFKFDFERQAFLACIGGAPAPMRDSEDGGAKEELADDDAGSVRPNCIDACLPTWK